MTLFGRVLPKVVTGNAKDVCANAEISFGIEIRSMVHRDAFATVSKFNSRRAHIRRVVPLINMTNKINASSQQSRFDPKNISESKDIDLQDLCLSIGRREILQHARFTLKSGLRYVFAGRNGLGKSTILRALAERQIPGISSKIKIVLLNQTIELEAAPINDATTVLQVVLASDKDYQKLLEDAVELSEAVRDSADSERIIRTYRRLLLRQCQQEHEAARLDAQHRSGARGALARKILVQCETSVKEAERKLGETALDLADGREIDQAIAMLETMQLALVAMGSRNIESRARAALIGLGFTDEQIDSPIVRLSGGWRTRVMLAGVLIQKADVLILDEPTNFLDLPATIWLQDFLTDELAPDTTLIVTTHDRDFADAVGERLLILRANPPYTLQTFTGTLSDYYAELRRQIQRMTKMSDALDKKKEHMESTIQRSIAAARRTGDDKKLKQAASRKKKLEERTGLEVSATGTRFKLNRDLAGFHLTARASIEVPDFDPPISMMLPAVPTQHRNGGSLASLEHVQFRYKHNKKLTLQDINLVISPGSRTGLVGLNGSGKSTLINLLTQDTSSPSSTAGIRTGILAIHSQARVAHYSQHGTSHLLAVGEKDTSMTALSYLQNLYSGISEQQIRILLSGLSLSTLAQARTPLAALSGGQLVRVALATCFLPMTPHLLILDEPTTHLDADSIVALIESLKQFEGALLVVSHDRFFMRCVVEGRPVRKAMARGQGDESEDSSDEEPGVLGTVYRLTKTSGRLIKLDGGVDEYERFTRKSSTRN